eukprot:CAMPEP_0114510046 /NCGR_PEP_ID=MMETSP0109-20121206/13563_1 /TAXON_ID=29199 /ORGANISM="Chlorarachnion reptans, Strain CCCM449" /LENGTH=135 /DNA_ID=CAMNT_0001689297 /DNA_START=92 /DNA_END=496 /DNA_ORIENTATION=+
MAVLLLALLAVGVLRAGASTAAVRSRTRVHSGLPNFARVAYRVSAHKAPLRLRSLRCRASEEQEGTETQGKGNDRKPTWAGVRQLVSMGMGTMAGDIKEINLKDPKRTVVLELEANNFEDADGNPLSGKYRDKGW